MSLTQTGTLQDLKSDVLDALQGRTDVSDSTIANYAAHTLRELTESQPFNALRTTGPNVTLVAGQAAYPITTFENANEDYSMPLSMAVYVDIGTNSIVAPIRYRTQAAIEPMSAPSVQGIPAWFSHHGSDFILGPVPNAAYVAFLRYQVRHPFSSPPVLTDPIYLPLSWYDIVAYGTAERIAVSKRWNDQAKYLHDILYGDPDYQLSEGKRGRPGLIAARTFSTERDQQYNSRSLGIVVGRYTQR